MYSQTRRSLLTASILIDAASLFLVSLAHVARTARVNIPSIVILPVDMQDLLALNTQHTNINQLSNLSPGLSECAYPESTHSVNPVQSC
jgi:hypothetical protein